MLLDGLAAQGFQVVSHHLALRGPAARNLLGGPSRWRSRATDRSLAICSRAFPPKSDLRRDSRSTDAARRHTPSSWASPSARPRDHGGPVPGTQARPSAVVAEPETNGVIEPLLRTIKEQAIDGRIFQTIDEGRNAMRAFADRPTRCSARPDLQPCRIVQPAVQKAGCSACSRILPGQQASPGEAADSTG